MEQQLDPEFAAMLRRTDGLVCAVVQQFDTGEVLMVGWMNDEALRRTLAEGRVTYWSRSRGEYWRKGDTSGHVQQLRGLRVDCDGDALLLSVDQVGAACHNGTRSCFDTYRYPLLGTDSPALSATPAGMQAENRDDL